MIQGLVVLNYDESTSRAAGTGILIAVAGVATFVNTLGARYLPLFEGIVLLLHFLGFLVVVIILLVLAPKISARAVFTTFNNGGGWLNAAAACTVGQLSSLFSFLGMYLKTTSWSYF